MSSNRSNPKDFEPWLGDLKASGQPGILPSPPGETKRERAPVPMGMTPVILLVLAGLSPLGGAAFAVSAPTGAGLLSLSYATIGLVLAAVFVWMAAVLAALRRIQGALERSQR
jgi:hypothetical protein